MNKYKKLIELIENNGLEIQSKKCYDPQSAWHGEELWIVDKKTHSKFKVKYCRLCITVKRLLYKIFNFFYELLIFDKKIFS